MFSSELRNAKELVSRADDELVFIMPPGPKPDQIRASLNSCRAMMNAHARRPIPADFFEMQRGMLRIEFQQHKIFVGEFLNFARKLFVELPELWIGAMLHKSVQRPLRKSLVASAASASRRPAATSCSNCLSHASASNSANQPRKAASSSVESLLTAVSISFIVLTR